MNATRARLPAAERRAALLDSACRAFLRGSYRGTTTAEIAREAGVTEPILYRHFESKRCLYLACLAEAWSEVRKLWDATIEAERDPGKWLGAMGHAYLGLQNDKARIATLWLQSLTEAAEDPEIRKVLRRHIREVHDYVADVVRRAQAAGGVVADRDPDAEAWIFIALGLLTTVDERVGGPVKEDLESVFASRRRWMTGSS
jgi:AcrR family transcriptional regulator